MSENEIKAQKFLQYVADNQKELKYILSKNITMDKEIFDDVFNEAILKAYDSIIKNNTQIKDYKNYFYICLKWTYVLRDNRNKKYKSNAVRDYFNTTDIIDDDTDSEERYLNAVSNLYKLKEAIKEAFGVEAMEIYFEYYHHKTQGGYFSYRKLGDILQKDHKEISNTITNIKQWIKNNPEINKLRYVV